MAKTDKEQPLEFFIGGNPSKLTLTGGRVTTSVFKNGGSILAFVMTDDDNADTLEALGNRIVAHVSGVIDRKIEPDFFALQEKFADWALTKDGKTVYNKCFFYLKEAAI